MAMTPMATITKRMAMPYSTTPGTPDAHVARSADDLYLVTSC